MSIKTLRKRIALVAVSALGAGLMSVASVAPASGAVYILQANEIRPKLIGNGNTALTACAVDATGGVDTAVIPLSSPGLVFGTTVINSATTDATGYVSVTGPGLITSAASTAAVGWSPVTQTSLTSPALGTTTALSVGQTANDFTVKPTGLGTIRVTYSLTSTSGALDAITVTVVEKCSNLAYSSALSLFKVVTEATAIAITSWQTNTSTNDEDASTVASGGVGYVAMSLKDAYGAELLGTKPLIASVTGANCLVALTARQASAAAYLAASGSGTTAVESNSGYNRLAIVTQADSDIPAKCTLNVTWDGNNVGSKTFTFRGIPAKITVSDVTIGTTSSKGYYRVAVEDAAGNPLPDVAIGSSSSQADNAAAISKGVITSAQGTAGVTTTSTATSIGKTRSITAASIADDTVASRPASFDCTAAGGTAKITVRATINASTASYLTSAPFDIACSGSLATWTVSMDKATYAPGEIATLTLSGKDSSGRPVASLTGLTGVTYAFGGMTAVTAPTNGDTFTSGAGIKTYQFSVGTSEGSFVGTFTTTGSVDTTAKTVQYKVANQNAAVSTNEVLAAIVKLIATINKQIRQLQKQLRR